MGLATITKQDNPEAIPFLVAAAVAAAVATLARRRRAVPGGRALFEAAELLIVDPPINFTAPGLRLSLAQVAVSQRLTKSLD